MTERAAEFRALHVPGAPLLMPNPWDVGTARLLAGMGFRALATTSAGFAGTQGRTDGNVTRDEALAHAAAMVAAVDVPVSADLENGFADEPAGVAETVRLAAGVGLAGCSVEDWDPRRRELYAVDAAVERVAAAAAAAHAEGIVLTARADGHIHGRRDPEDLDETIRRLQMYAMAGADVVYAPGVDSVDGIRRIVRSVDRPVNVLALPGTPPIARLAELGVARVSTGSGLFWAALGGVASAAEELRDHGTYEFWSRTAPGRHAAALAFRDEARAAASER
jgi:2-methylisocitrate lyase-like PEP mutase family enzyme